MQDVFHPAFKQRLAVNIHQRAGINGIFDYIRPELESDYTRDC